MKIVFMGTPDFAATHLESLLASKHEVALVVTKQDKPQKRSSKLVFSFVKEVAIKNNIEVAQPEKVSDETFINRLKEIAPDIIVVVAYGKILTESVLNIPKYGCINVHASLLPKYRGASPIQWSILNGDEKTGITIMQMGVGLDDGDILLSKEIEIDKKETGASLFEKLSVLGSQALILALENIENNTIKRIKQDDSKATYVKMLTKEMGNIDFNQSAIEIERKIRGLNSWPLAFTFINGKRLTIWDANVIDEDFVDEKNIGKVTEISKSSFIIQCKFGKLEILSVQLSGKKRMNVADFLNGNTLKIGDTFTREGE